MKIFFATKPTKVTNSVMHGQNLGLVTPNFVFLVVFVANAYTVNGANSCCATPPA